MNLSKSRPLTATAFLLMASAVFALGATGCGVAGPLAKAESQTGINAVEIRTIPRGWTRDSVTTGTATAPSISQVFLNPDVPGEWFEINHYKEINFMPGTDITVNGEPARRDYHPPDGNSSLGRLSISWQSSKGGTLIWATIGENLTEEMVMNVAEKLREAE